MAIGIVTIECPRTHERVPVGLEIDGAAYAASKPAVRRFRCPSCNAEHAWSKAIARWDAPAAASPALPRPVAARAALPPPLARTAPAAKPEPPRRSSIAGIVSRIAPKGWSGRP